MYPLGLLSLVQALVPEHAALKLGIALPGVVLVILLYTLSARSHDEDDGPPTLPLGTVETIWSFFQARHDFIARGFELTGQASFRFKLFQVRELLYGIAQYSANAREFLEYSCGRVGGTCTCRFLRMQGPRYQRGLQGPLGCRGCHSFRVVRIVRI